MVKQDVLFYKFDTWTVQFTIIITMDLEKITKALLDDSRDTPPRGLTAIAEAEKYLQQAYEGRYIFELVQNVRDANKEVQQYGEIYIECFNNILCISNTGAEFNEKGIESITTIGQSPKNSQDFIGFKGIGFKAIQEITELPRIVTRYGSIIFDKNLTLKSYARDSLTLSKIPLFYFPYFDSKILSAKELENNIVTRIELPLKEGVGIEKIIKDVSDIQPRQLVLLGNIAALEFKSKTFTTEFKIRRDSLKSFIEVSHNNVITRYKYFSPSRRLIIPSEIIEKLEGKEKEVFSNSQTIDVTIVLELLENGQIEPIHDAKLYLFYPLQISSGFRFIIHSYFIVNPERLGLRDSAINDFLLTAIGEFIATEMLSKLKSTKINTNKVLCFKRNNDAKLEKLYDSLVATLSEQKFIYDSRSKRYYRASEIMVADGFDRGLFEEGRLGDRVLIYTDDKEVIEWLQTEFQVPYLSYNDIAEQIELECKRQLKLRNLRFFQRLYNYVSENEGLNLTGKKVLLTSNWKLISSEDDVFYGGLNQPENLAPSVKKKIHFIHKDVKISDFREGRSRTGITEYNTYELVRRLLKLFNDRNVPKIDVLNSIFSINNIEAKAELEIRENILLPIKNSDRWLSPVTNPIYFELEHLRELYPDGNFVDEGFIVPISTNEGSMSKEAILKRFGVWEIPAIYIDEKQKQVKQKTAREKQLARFSGLSSRPFIVQFDRALDVPSKYNCWFTDTIIGNWKLYHAFLMSDFLPKFRYGTPQSYWRRVINKEDTIILSHLIEALTQQKWICFKGDDLHYAAGEIIGIGYAEFNQSHNYILRKYSKLLPIDYGLSKSLIEAIGILHLNTNSPQILLQILSSIYETYITDIPAENDFADYYNRILSRLVDIYESGYITEDVLHEMSFTQFLAVDDLTKKLEWKEANEVLYIDDKPAYNLLPLEIKAKLQPLFTNRDKNTFGKIANKIGRIFSKSITRQLQETTVSEVVDLQTYVGVLPEVIALLESHLGDAISKNIPIFKTVNVYEKNEMNIKISVSGSSEITVAAAHFIDNSGYKVYVVRNAILNKHKQLAEMLNELFTLVLERDLRNFTPIVLNYLKASSTERQNYLNSYDITQERLSEIVASLHKGLNNPTQRFWQAILFSKGCTADNIFAGESTDCDALSEAIYVSTEVIHRFEKQFNFDNTSSPDNIHVLIYLLNSLSLSLADINIFNVPKIDFRSYYKAELDKVKNRFEKSFSLCLYQYLSTKDLERKMSYQDYLDQYKYQFHYTIPPNELEVDLSGIFIRSLKENFDFLDVDEKHLMENTISFNPITFYNEHYTHFQLLVSALAVPNHAIEQFLANNKRRSLLYFGESEKLFTDVQIWWSSHSKPINAADNEKDLENMLKEFSLQPEDILESVVTSSLENGAASPGGGSGNKSGTRYDGGANDQYKNKIGLVAEMVAFELLALTYHDVVWVSKNAAKVYKSHPGYNPEGEDGLGHDIEYLDEEGNKIYVEVKGRADGSNSFDITRTEIIAAHQKSNYYKIILVNHTLDSANRRVRNLGNIFMLEEGGDFFSNSKFTANYQNFEIKFR